MVLEWLDFNLRADRIKPKDWAEARDWTLTIASLSGSAVKDEEKRKDAISANRAVYEAWWSRTRTAEGSGRGGG